ncbi:MAG: aminoacetone oxidase family FAD-binding enzyme [Clostridia bacterium]|nr:aminoacetone oxidase family FAD-binding enzyme [Clostridia bacterium]
MEKTVVVGGGAAGMAAAVEAAREGGDVTVLERNEKPLKKLSVTGNGRGNILNRGAPLYYGDAAFAAKVLRRMPYERLAAFWEDLGVPLRQEEEGRCYPAALQAAVAVDALRLRARQLAVQICTRTRVTGLSVEGASFVLDAEESAPPPPCKIPAGPAEVTARKYRASRVIVAAGGAAAPAHGTDGTAYGLLTGFGHTLIPCRPALCALLTATKPAALAGQRIRATLTLRDVRGRELHRTRGELLFAKDGVSGIAAMQLARFVTGSCMLTVDMREEINQEGTDLPRLSRFLRDRASKRPELPMGELFTGMLMPQVSQALMGAAGVLDRDLAIGRFSDKVYDALAKSLTELPITVKGVRGFSSAQVTAGGIVPSDFCADTMESRFQKGLFAAGEMLDVDGDCGGFNLMFAVATGLLAGRR